MRVLPKFTQFMLHKGTKFMCCLKSRNSYASKYHGMHALPNVMDFICYIKAQNSCYLKSRNSCNLSYNRACSYEWKWTWGERSGAFSSVRQLHVKGVFGQWSSGNHKRKEYVVCPKSKCTDFLFDYLLELPEITSYLLQSMTLGKLHSGSNISSTDHSNTGSHFP